jgi:peptide/nickel transport system substrate-binding protein
MHLKNLIVVVLLLGLVACNKGGLAPVNLPIQQPTQTATATPPTPAVAPATPTLPPSRLLSICLVQEPRSLFLYNAVSSSEQSVLSAIYDGPIDTKDYIAQPVILERLPSVAGGDALLQAVPVSPGDLIVDALGNLVNLGDGVFYKPAGCSELACAQTYSGSEPVELDQLVLQFRLLAGLQWSDGEPLTAADSLYSYEIASSLYPSAVPERVSRTASYEVLDNQTVEWTGLPGFIDGLYQAKFFPPLPQHAWAGIPAAELPSDEAASRKPIGWGAYVIDEWVTGDHITLHANPLYFRAGEGLPHFNNLVYRFVSDSHEAQLAVMAGECDLAEQVSGFEAQAAALLQMRDEGRISLAIQSGYAWEVLEFNLSPLSADRPAYFASRDVRQAVAMCIDRQALVDRISAGQMQVADLYVPGEHPLYNSQAKQYALDVQAASELLAASGWLDSDNDPSTPRIAQGVGNVPDGTPFAVQYLVSGEEERQAVAQMIQANLKQCGIQVEAIIQPVEDYLAAGPGGPVFGRQFDLAQFAWMNAVEPPCSLYLTSEIPGPYPDFPKGWGGVNASGYSNPLYDAACLEALNSLPGTPQHQEKHTEAQAIFAVDLPNLPLYWHSRVVIGRPDLCNLEPGMAIGNIFSSLESFNYGEACP